MILYHQSKYIMLSAAEFILGPVFCFIHINDPASACAHTMPIPFVGDAMFFISVCWFIRNGTHIKFRAQCTSIGQKSVHNFDVPKLIIWYFLTQSKNEACYQDGKSHIWWCTNCTISGNLVRQWNKSKTANCLDNLARKMFGLIELRVKTEW